jgi:hypothetical protein
VLCTTGIGMSKKKKKYCNCCHKKFKKGQERRYYRLYNYGMNIKFHVKCFERIKQIARRRKIKIGYAVYLVVLGLIER